MVDLFKPAEPLGSKFRNSGGNLYVRQLFYEMTGDKSSVLYTLKDRPWAGYPSLYQLYMGKEDMFEFDFANEYFEGYDHWQLIAQAKWFEEYVSRWRHELALKVQSQALVRLINDSKSGSRSSAASNKYLLDKGWLSDVTKKSARGRPSKDEVRAEARRQAELTKQIDDDFTRLSIPGEIPTTEQIQ